MNKPKFTFNAFLLVVVIFSALYFFVTIGVTNVADRTAVNGFFPIEGTEYSVFYSSLEPDGIYSGTANDHKLVLEGTFGNDWGAFLEGDELYINEFRFTDLGFVRSSIVKVNVKTLEKETVFKNALLRGRCLSGEPVCSLDFSLPSNFPASNSLCSFDNLLTGGGRASKTAFLDPESGEIVFTVENAIERKFNDLYLNRTLEEVMA